MGTVAAPRAHPEGRDPGAKAHARPWLVVALVLVVLVVTFTGPDGRRGGAIPFDDATFRTLGPGAARGCAARLVTMAGLGIPPGSTDEQFALVVTDASVVSVAMTRPAGSVDEMAPVDGVALLATRSAWGTGAHPRALAADGRAADVC